MNTFWKVCCMLLLVYTFVFGFYGEVPDLPILNQSIRNLYFHVAMWFVMMLSFSVATFYAFKNILKHTPSLEFDKKMMAYTNSGFLFGILGLTTGMVWAKYTWGEYWSNDPKQLGALISILMYLAFYILRKSIRENELKIKISNIFNVFCYLMLFPSIWILPRLVDSLHPGGEGNPAMNVNDIDNKMRMVFYPAVIGWFLLSLWISDINYKILKLKKNNV